METMTASEICKEFYEHDKQELTQSYEKRLEVINKCIRQLEDIKADATTEYEHDLIALKAKHGQ